MAKVAFHFRHYATDDTEHWNLEGTPLEGVPVFGISYFLEGEATHICSFEANSRCDFLRNDFLTELAPDPEAAEAYLDSGEGSDLPHENGGEWTAYYGFIDVKSPSKRPYIGERVTFTLDTRDHDIDPAAYAESFARWKSKWNSPQEAHALARRDMLREAAWEAAREEFQSNWRGVPVLGPREYEAHRRRMALRKAEAESRYGSTAPLLAAAGVDAPLLLPPA